MKSLADKIKQLLTTTQQSHWQRYVQLLNSGADLREDEVAELAELAKALQLTPEQIEEHSAALLEYDEASLQADLLRNNQKLLAELDDDIRNIDKRIVELTKDKQPLVDQWNSINHRVRASKRAQDRVEQLRRQYPQLFNK